MPKVITSTWFNFPPNLKNIEFLLYVRITRNGYCLREVSLLRQTPKLQLIRLQIGTESFPFLKDGLHIPSSTTLGTVCSGWGFKRNL